METPRKSIRPAVFYALKDLAAHKRTILFTVLVLAFAHLLVLFSRFLIYGFEKTMENSIINVSGSLAITPLKKDVFLKNASITERAAQNLKGIQATNSRLSHFTQIKIGHELQRVSWSKSGILFLEGVSLPDNTTILPSSMTRGRYFTDENETGIIFGQHVTADIEKHLNRQLTIGEPITLIYQNGLQATEKIFSFKGVIEPHNYVVDESVLIPKKQLEALLNKNDIASFIAIKTDPRIDLEKIKSSLEKLNLQAQIKTWRDFDYLNVLDIVKGVKTIGNIIFLVSILATAMVVAIVIYLNVLSKRRQIAIMKAIGATKLSVILIFAAESFLFTFLGISIGGLFYLLLHKYLLIYPISMPFGDVIPVFNLKDDNSDHVCF